MIRQATTRDLPRLTEIYTAAKTFMKNSGNPHQWNGAYPDTDTLLSDIQQQQLYVMEENERVFACFALIGGADPTYAHIDGAWLSDTPYGTIHRIASDGTHSGVFACCVAFARNTYAHLRVDTHKDNTVMQAAVKRSGFIYTGVIYLADGSPRLAYEWELPTALAPVVTTLKQENCTCVIQAGDQLLTSRTRGVAFLLSLPEDTTDLSGALVADKVVGRGAAFLYVLLNVRAVYALVMSESAREVLSQHGIQAFCEQCPPRIINRDNTGFCPIETAVQNDTDPLLARVHICEKLAALQAKK